MPRSSGRLSIIQAVTRRLGPPTILALGAALAVAACGGAVKPRAVPDPRPIVVIVMENHEYFQIVGSSSAPYINRKLVRKGRVFTDFHALTHPSLPNYLTMTSGSTQGKEGTDTVSAGEIHADNLFHQLSKAGISWRSYMGAMPRRCYKPFLAGELPHDYELKHDPAMTYRNIAGSGLCNNVVPLRFLPGGVLPRFSFVVPDQCDDMHSCSIETGDNWLAAHVPALLDRDAIVILTFDEGTSYEGDGGRILTVEVGRGIRPARKGSRFTHYGLLAALEDHFHLRRMGGARKARPLPLQLWRAGSG
jgi:phosphatidylinositol-3-phosphatase